MVLESGSIPLSGTIPDSREKHQITYTMTLQLLALMGLLSVAALLLIGLGAVILYRHFKQPVNTIDFYEELANSIEVDTTYYEDDTVIFNH